MEGRHQREGVIRTIKAIRVKSLIPGVLAFVLLGLLVHFGVSTERERQYQIARSHVSQEALTHLARLEAELNANVFLANGMVAYIISQNGVDNPGAGVALQALHQFGRHVRNIAIAPGNRISLIYPLESNQAAMGLYYPEVPTQWPVVKRAIESRSTILAGPVSLRQGGIGLISRTPVFFPDGHYWGLVSIVLDADNLFRSVGLDGALSSEGVRYSMRGRDGQGEDGEVFYGDPGIFAEDALIMNVNVPGGIWQLAAVPVEGWGAGTHHLDWLEVAGLLLALGVAGVIQAFQRNGQRVAESEKRLRAFLDTTQDGVVVIDEEGLIRAFNPAAETLFGYKADEVLGTSVNRLMPRAYATVHDRFIAVHDRMGRRNMAGGRDVHGRRKDGSEFPVEVTVGATTINDRRIHVGVVRDITERKAYERKLMDLATTDPLTATQNRRAFLDAAQEIFSLAKRYGHPLSLLMIDADHFKAINDGYGHQVGDMVLVRLAQVTRSCLRTTDRLGRFGGEEFVVLLPESDQDSAIEVAERLLTVVRAQLVADGKGGEVTFTVSIGIGSLTSQMMTFNDLLRTADVALYEAKGQGRNRWCLPS